MRSLLLRIFVSFWSIIVITIAAAVAVGFIYAERVRTSIENFEVSDAMLEASTALQDGGRNGLTEWLEALPGATVSLIYILDDRGEDLLERRVPPQINLAMRRYGGPQRRRPPPPREFGNLRPARPFTQLYGPDNDVYTLFVLPPQSAIGRWLSQRGGAGFVIIALLVSAFVSYLLARAISQPIRRFRESAVAIGAGNLDTRVADRVGKRRDEIGMLAADFDRMTGELQRAWTKQTELARNVSHELRSPLARLRVALELARRKTGDLAELDKIDVETERLDELIGQILEFSRLDSDLVEDRSGIDVEELLRSVVEDVRFEYGKADTKAKLKLDVDATGTIYGHANALRSGIENVLRNAMQHNRDDGEVRVQLAADDSYLLVTIEDQGGGIAEDELANIFEPFYRAKSKRGESMAGGTGLGLAIASRAIAVNGGTLSAANSEQGLRVAIRLPTLQQREGN
ncbi:MAG: ATP-binding protein [Woeseiaceae bacterium]|nr:ATP-binding protein [Woeseiaceae bacterium]